MKNLDEGNFGRIFASKEDKYIVVDEATLEKIKLETSKTLGVTQFMRGEEPDPILIDRPPHMAPDGAVAEEPSGRFGRR